MNDIIFRTEWTLEKVLWLWETVGKGQYKWYWNYPIEPIPNLAFCFAEDANAFRLAFDV